MDHAPIGIALIALDGRFLRVNAVLCRITGYTEAELLARRFQDITLPTDLDRRARLVAELNHYALHQRYLHARGYEVWVEYSVALAWNQYGEPLHFVGQVKDISARREQVNRLAELATTTR